MCKCWGGDAALQALLLLTALPSVLRYVGEAPIKQNVRVPHGVIVVFHSLLVRWQSYFRFTSDNRGTEPLLSKSSKIFK